MSFGNGQYSELTELLEALCDDCSSPAQTVRLEQLVMGDRDARRLYLEYIELHGTLHWDTAKGSSDETLPTTIPAPAAVVQTSITATDTPSHRRLNRSYAASAAIAVLLLVGLGAAIQQRLFPPNSDVHVADNPDSSTGNDTTDTPANTDTPGPGRAIDIPVDRIAVADAPRHLPVTPHPKKTPSEAPVVAPGPPQVAANETQPSGGARVQLASPVEFIDEQIAAGWTLAGVDASPSADDSEWIRRVYLDVTGRIPAAEAVDRFLKDKRSDKRTRLVEELLDGSAYVANWTTIWTNLLIGRADVSDDVNRPALQRFLRRSFGRNRPWSEVVYELVSAEGDNEENGATNFLLAHLNNKAVPATAVTARLFLGMQVQCTQCHRHPFNNNWKQSQFWELNSCFQQTVVVHRRVVDPKTGRAKRATELVSKPLAGPIFYENRQQVMRSALPKVMGVSIDPGAETNRRQELARLVIEGGDSQVARAMVNRMWHHFFGYAFTRPLDDMGPHRPVTHPALLDRLTGDFVASGYDVKQLIRWICNSQPYQLSSRYGETNIDDDPAAGATPLFSRMYVKSMTVEQLYDSMLAATRLDESRGNRWDETEQQRRQEWLLQFVFTYDTEENDETTTFDGTLPQALMMMNGQLVQQALSAEGDTYLKRVVTSRDNETEKIRKLFLAALSRYPTTKELASFRKLLREQTAARGGNRRQAQAEALQDLFWAFLNSSEFILVH
jgi:hypothetical protein